MTAKKKRVSSVTVKQTLDNKDYLEFGMLHQIAFWGLALLLFLPPYLRGLFFAPEQEKTLIFATVVFGLTFLWRWLQNDHIFLRGPMDYFALALPLIYIISTITAVNKGLAIDEVVKNILYFLVYWSASRLVRNQGDVYKLLHVIYLSAIGVALAGLATATGLIHIKDGYNVGQFGGFISSTFQYHNALAAYLGAVIFIGFYLWYKSFNEHTTYGFDKLKALYFLYLIGNFFLLTVLFASKSRAGLLVFALVLVIYLLGLGSQKRLYTLLTAGGLGAVAYLASKQFIGSVQNGSNWQAWLWIAGGIILAVAIQMFICLIRNLATNKWGDSPKQYLLAFVSLAGMALAAGVIWLAVKPGLIEKITGFDFLWTAYHRFYYMGSAIDMIKERPILGWGGGGWQEAYEAFLNFRYTTRQAHSYYFQVAVETGLTGMAVVLGLWISYITLTFRQLRDKLNDMSHKQLIWLFLVMFLMIGGHAVVDFDLSLSAITILLWCIFGVTSALATPLEDRSEAKAPIQHKSIKYLPPALATICMVVIFSGAAVLVQANSLGNKGYQFLNANDINRGIEYVGKASLYNPHNSNYHLVLSQAYAKQGNLAIALIEAKLAVNKSMYSVAARNNYIQIALTAGQNKQAARENEYIYKLTPNSIEAYEGYATNYLNLGISELQSGNREDAKAYLNKALNVSLLISQQEKQLTDIDKDLWEGPLLADTERIYLVKGQAAYCLGMFSDALNYLQQAAQGENSEIKGQALLWQGLVQDRKGNQAEADQLLNQINQVNPQLMQNYQALKSIPVL
ncbi:O-Antigen ligase [Sporotomaculum syntrophicum]|uniref:O-Antigen ligase n=1 Tax=Sporotomaculum syntrophicum TaxID=182264 RepID=A0A9D2WSD9_9FIRM|nr:O-antigen ligase family protein [Sporotomaculum syntrophicum]KAF1086046.1 O-Antigen ligase [Sporotomaculum syntrophicum]